MSNYDPNQDCCVGHIGKVTRVNHQNQEIQIYISGVYWMAENIKKVQLSIGDKVEVVRRESNKAFIKKLSP